MLSYSSRPPDPAIVGDAWRAMWLNRLENEPFLSPLWLRHSARDAYWKRGSICEDFSAVKAAVLSIGGWHDGYRKTIANLVAGIEAPVKGIMSTSPRSGMPVPLKWVCEKPLMMLSV